MENQKSSLNSNFNKLLFLIIFLFSRNLPAQNLVSNPGFEDTVHCPVTAGQIEWATGWQIFGESPDYYNACAPSCNFCVGVPDNFSGHQSPYLGNAYAGLVTSSVSIHEAREYIATELVNPLQIGKKYFVSAYICRGSSSQAHGASNNFGFKFTSYQYTYFNPIPANNFAQVVDTSILLDSLNWTLFSGSFSADSNYKYLVIGNFFDDAHTDTVEMDSANFIFNSAYYLIDEVCVTPDSGNCSPLLSVQNNLFDTNFKIYFKNGQLIIDNPQLITAEMEIYNLSGQRVFQNNLKSNTESYNVHDFPSQLYVLKIVFNRQTLITRIFKQDQ
jgi:hypothetical protein